MTAMRATFDRSGTISRRSPRRRASSRRRTSPCARSRRRRLRIPPRPRSSTARARSSILSVSAGGPATPIDGGGGGDRIGPYRLIKELGRGGQGAVHLAEDTRLGRRVALKVLTGVGSLTDANLRRFQREAELASKLDNPAHLRRVRLRRVRGRALHRDAVRRRRDARQEDLERESSRRAGQRLRADRDLGRRVRAAVPDGHADRLSGNADQGRDHGGRADHGARGARHPRRSRIRRDPSRPQARQHHGRRVGRAGRSRLRARARPGGRRGLDHEERRFPRDAGLHVARADRFRPHPPRPAQRRLFARRHAVRVPHAAEAVRRPDAGRRSTRRSSRRSRPILAGRTRRSRPT